MEKKEEENRESDRGRDGVIEIDEEGEKAIERCGIMEIDEDRERERDGTMRK